MSDHFAWTHPIARGRHRCWLCHRIILPGEMYRRCAELMGVDGVNTFKYCEHCYRVSETWCRHVDENEYDPYLTIEWLGDEYPAILAALRAHWRYPDGALVPWPFQRHCADCRAPIDFNAIWCLPCDRERIARVTRQLADLQAVLP